MTTAYRYVGPGTYYGVPARDIDQVEFVAMSPAHQRIVRVSDAYEGDDPTPTLSDMKRDDLNDLAVARGIDPSGYGTKGDLIDAITADQEGTTDGD